MANQAELIMTIRHHGVDTTQMILIPGKVKILQKEEEDLVCLGSVRGGICMAGTT